MKTLQIQIPQGYEVDTFDTKTGEIKFKESLKSAIERIKTIEDVLQDNGLTQSEFDHNYEGLTEDETSYILIKLLVCSLNEGWIPDWNNKSEYKYYPWFEMGSSGFRYDAYVDWASNSGVGSRLCFKSSDLAKYAGTQFTELYKSFMIIN